MSGTVVGQQAGPLPHDPSFAKIFVSEINDYNPARADKEPADPSQALARRWVEDAVLKPEPRRQVFDYLDSWGTEGAAAKAKLMALIADPAAAPPEAGPARIQADAAPSPNLDSLRNVKWDEAGSRAAFDGDLSRAGGATAVQAGQGAPHPPGLSASPNLPDMLTKPLPPGTVKVVSVSWDKLQQIAQKQVYEERKADFDKAFGVAQGVGIDGGGFFKAKILTPAEVAADPVKQAARDDAAKTGERLVFVRTDTKAQLGGNATIPIGAPAGASVSAGLRLSGIVEIVETRAVPEEKAGALEHAEQRVFLWPLTARHLKEVMRVGEDLTITGRLDEGAAQSIGANADLGLPAFAHVGANAGAGVGKAEDQWVTLHVKKVDPDHVRILVQRADGETFSVNVAASAGLNIYDDQLIPTVTPTSLEQGLLGKAVLSGERGVLHQIQNLLSASLSASWGKGKDDLAAEGWASVPLSDGKVAAALDSFFKFRPEALRGLSADGTFSQALKAGRLNAEVRDVTRNEAFQAHVSKLKIALSEGTAFYEVRWRQDGVPKHYVVGIANSNFHGDVTKTNRAEQSAMWYDLDTGRTAVTIALGPQDRLLTTTREKINDVIATQKAMGVPVTGKIDEPSPYLQLFGLGNYGRSEEKGTFYLSDEGVNALKQVGREQLIAAYLHADWLYERQSWPPGENFWAESKPPAWADTMDPAAIKPALDFLHDHAAEARRLQGADKSGRGELARLGALYSRVAPGRSLLGDAWRYTPANDYANAVRDMQASDKPEQLIELFLRFRHDDSVDLKRAVVATAMLAGETAGADGKPVPNWQGYLQMTGNRVQLLPAGGPPTLPQHPVGELNAVFNAWQ